MMKKNRRGIYEIKHIMGMYRLWEMLMERFPGLIIIDEYRRIRGYMSLDFYNHASEVFDESSWAIWQYHDADLPYKNCFSKCIDKSG